MLKIGGLVVAAGAAAVLVYLLVPNHKGGITSSTPQTGPVQTVAHPKQVPVSVQTRTALNELFDRFVPAAIARRDPEAARALVTPNLRAQATRAQWRAGTIPVPPFDPAGTTFHGWRPFYSYPKLVSVEVTLEPKRASDPVGSFVVNVKKVGQDWLVDSIYQEGQHGGGGPPTTTTSAAPTTPTVTEHVVGGSRGRLGAIWLLIPLGLLSLIVIVPILVFSRQWLGDYRVRRKDGGKKKELPPLPKPRDRDEKPL